MVHRKMKRTRRKERTKRRPKVKRTKMKKVRMKRSKMNKKNNRRKRTKKKNRKEKKGGGWEGDYEWFTDNKWKRRDEIKEERLQSMLGKLKSLRQNDISMVWTPYEFRILEIGQGWEQAKESDAIDTRSMTKRKGYAAPETAEGSVMPEAQAQQHVSKDDMQKIMGPMLLTDNEIQDRRLTPLDIPTWEDPYKEVRHKVSFCNEKEIEYKTVIFAYNFCVAGKGEKKSKVFSELVDKYTKLVKEYIHFRDHYMKQNSGRWSYRQNTGEVWTSQNAEHAGKIWKQKKINEASKQIHMNTALKLAAGATALGVGALTGTGLGAASVATAVGAAGHAAYREYREKQKRENPHIPYNPTQSDYQEEYNPIQARY